MKPTFENKIWTPDQELRALTLKEPFASLMLHGKIETRKRPTKVRGWVMICAGLSEYSQSQLFDISGPDQLFRINESMFHAPQVEGQATTIAHLSDCRPMTPEDEDACFVKYREGLYCWIFTEVKAISPLPWSGKQGWSFVSQEFKDKIRII